MGRTSIAFKGLHTSNSTDHFEVVDDVFCEGCDMKEVHALPKATQKMDMRQEFPRLSENDVLSV